MRKCLLLSIAFMTAILSSISVFGQGITINGQVKAAGQEILPSASVMVRGSSLGTFTDEAGNFKITVPKLPVTLIVSSVGFETKEVTVTDASANVMVELAVSSSIGQEVVVSATRSPERILESPVTVEKMSTVTLRSTPSPNYYEAIQNLKGVDMHTASMTFRTVTTRGFISSGNTRLIQLIDGMDNQAPGLNFAVGGVIGPTELDVESVELLPGASSALYGSGGMNGTLLINTKNPFRSEGLSLQAKLGVMHLDDRQRGASPYHDWSVRYAAAYKKFAFKIGGQFIKAQDWEAYDYDNVQRTSVNSKIVPGNRSSDPNYDGVNVYGDETTANMKGVSYNVIATVLNAVPAAALPPGFPRPVRPDQIPGLLVSPYRPFLDAVLPMSPGAPFYAGIVSGITPDQNVSRSGYEERHLVDYNTVNFKVNGGLHYKITDRIEASLSSFVGTGTTVYTGANRYSLKGLKMAQHKLEIRSNSWFVRGYTTQENAGKSYNATVLGQLVNEAWKPSTTWYPQYIGAYIQARSLGATDYAAHQAARGFADAGRLMPGTAQYNNTLNDVRSKPIPKGALFLDKSDLWAAEGQLNLSDVANFSETVEVITGFQLKQYVLNSQNTLFADSAGAIKPSETGGYVQLRKRFLDDALTLTGAVRYDKHSNFDGRFTPRITASYRVAPENILRLSYQTAYRFPTNQDQYINLFTGSGTLIGSLPEFQTFYNLNTNPGYSAESVTAYRLGGNPANTSMLQKVNYKGIKPESVSQYEIGYKSILNKKLYVDAYVYYSQYKDFLGRVAVVQPVSGTPEGTYDPSSASVRNYSYLENTDTKVNAFGYGITAEYQLPRKFTFYGNYFSDEINDVPEGFASSFNAPKYRFNVGIRNENIFQNVGFNLLYKRVGETWYEGTFVMGTLPSYGNFDAQITYRLPATKSMFRFGGTNILNNYYRSGYGSPYVGGLYYVSFGYNVF